MMMEDKLVQILERFEEAFVEFTKGKDAFSLKSDYIEFKYDIVKLLMTAVDESVEFDFEKFVEPSFIDIEGLRRYLIHYPHLLIMLEFLIIHIDGYLKTQNT